MATNSKKQSRGKASKRRYFRRRRAKDVAGIEQDGEEQPTQGAPVKGQNRRRTANRRRSSRRRNNRPERTPEKTVPHEEDSQPPTDVYIYTHVIRPAYKEGAGGDFYADHTLDLSATSDTPQPDMDHLLESIGRQLDEWFANNSGK